MYNKYFNEKMFNRQKIVENFALLLVTILVGIIVSLVAQIFIIGAKYIFNFLFFNPDFSLTIELFNYKLNLIPLIICVPASILVGIILLFSKIPRWYGPADTIFAAHTKAGTLDLKSGFTSTFASFISISGGASVGIYGPLVHFGATVSAFLRRLKFMPKIQHDIIIGSGVAAAISAGFGAPIAGIIFAHETVLRHFSLKAITSIALASMTANYTAIKLDIVSTPLLLENIPFDLVEVLNGLILIGPFAAIVAIIFMKLMLVINRFPSFAGIKNWQSPIIAGFACGIVGLFLDDVLGLGTNTLLNVITSNLDVKFLIFLLVGKLILTSLCIGLGFFGGVFSPALFLGALVGALIFNIPILNFEPIHLSVLAVSGMAALSSSVIGAPITAIILILELTGSYEYAIAATLPIAFCTFITSRIFGNSFFDKQLFSRGTEISKGREQISLNQIKISAYMDTKFTSFNLNFDVGTAIKKFTKDSTTEGYIIDRDNNFYGKIKLIDIIHKRKNQKIKDFVLTKPLILNPHLSLFDTIKKLSRFVGESIPIVDVKTNKMFGIISENDVLKAYLEISDEINHIEKD